MTYVPIEKLERIRRRIYKKMKMMMTKRKRAHEHHLAATSAPTQRCRAGSDAASVWSRAARLPPNYTIIYGMYLRTRDTRGFWIHISISFGICLYRHSLVRASRAGCCLIALISSRSSRIRFLEDRQRTFNEMSKEEYHTLEHEPPILASALQPWKF